MDDALFRLVKTLALVFTFCLLARRSEAADLKGIGPGEVVFITSLQQQLADIDGWTNTQFRKTAWDRVAAGLHRYLAKAAEQGEKDFRTEVERLVADRFRACIDLEAMKRYRVQLARFKDETKSVGKDSPVVLEVEVLESLMVLDAAYLALADQAKEWKAESWAGGSRLKAAEDTVVRALQSYQSRQRLEAKVRLLATQPSWLLDTFGPGVKDALAKAQGVVAAAGRLSAAAWNETGAIDERAKVLTAAKFLDDLRSYESALREVGVLTGAWFDLNAKRLLDLRSGWEKSLQATVIDFPADWMKQRRCFFRATVKPIAGILFEARLSFCRPLPGVSATVDLDRIKSLSPGASPAAAPGEVVPCEEVDLGIVLTRVTLRDGRLVPLPAGIGGDRRDDRAALAAAVHRFGLPPQFGVEGVKVSSVADDFSRVVIRFNVSVPGLPVTVPQELSISPEGLSASDPLAAVMRQKLNDVSVQLVKGLNTRPVEFAAPAGKVRLGNWQATGDWFNGAVGLSADVSVAGGASNYGSWTVPLEFVRLKDGTGWSLRIAAHTIPGRVTDALLSDVRAQLLKQLDFSALPKDVRDKTAKLPNFSEVFGKRLGLSNARFDPTLGQVAADIVWASPPSGVAFPAVGVSLSLSDAKLAFDLSSLAGSLKAHLEALAKSLLNDLVGNLARDAVVKLKGQELDLFAARLKITEVGEYDETRAGVPVEATVTAGGDAMTVRKLWLLGLKLPVTPKLDGLHADFSEVETSPGLDAFIRKLFGNLVKIPDTAVQVSGIRPVRDGIQAAVAVKIDALGDPLVVGEITFGLGGVRAEADLNALLKNIQAQVTQRLAAQFSKRTTLPSIGPVKNLRLDEAKSSFSTDGIRLYVKGEIATPLLDDIPIPFSGVQIFPELGGKIEIQPPPLDLLKGQLKSLFQFGDDSSPVVLLVTAPAAKTTAPYGVTFNVTLKAVAFQIEVGSVALTQQGLDLPDRVAARFPGYFPIGPLALVNPGVGIYLSNASKLDIVGDLTFAAPGIDKIVAIRASMTADIQSWGFELDGQLVLLATLPVFEVKGGVWFKDDEKKKKRGGTAELRGRSLPPLDSVLAVSGEIAVDGPAMTIRATSDLAVLGLKLFTLNLSIDGKSGVLHFEGGINFLLGSGRIAVDLAPDMSRCQGGAVINFKVGGFSIAEANVSISPGLTSLKFGILEFKVTINVATVSCLTPKLVLDVILSLFDFDPVAFFKAITRREVVVNLVDRNGKQADNPGEGDPLPGGGTPTPGQTKPPGGPPPTPPGTDKDGKPSTPASEYRESGNTITPGWQRPAPPGEKPKDNRPKEVYTYQPGTARIEFVPDPKDAARLVEVTTTEDGKFRWEGHFSVEQDVARKINKNSSAMILSSVWLRFPDGRRQKCRNGFDHDSGDGYLVLEPGGLFVAGMYPGGRYDKVDIDLSLVGQKLTADKVWEAIVSGQRPFSDGDLAVLSDLARAKVSPQAAVKDFRRLAGSSGKPEDDGYVYSAQDRPEAAAAAAVYQSRKGGRVTVPVSSPLFPVVIDPTSPLAAPVCEYLADAAAGRRSLSLLATERGTAGPSAKDPLQRPGVGRLLLTRREPDGKTWVDGMDATAPPQLRSALLTTDISASYDLTRPGWQADDFASAFGNALMALGDKPDDNEVRLGSPGQATRSAAFASRIGATDWTAKVLIQRPSSEKLPNGAVAASAVVSGKALSERYTAWRTGSANVLPQGAERFKDLANPDERRKLLDIVIGPPKAWPEVFNTNPIGLFIP